MATSVIISANTGTLDEAYNVSGTEWTDINVDNDSIIFSGGSNVVIDGATIPSASQLTQAGVVLDGTQQIVDKYFLSDISENELKEIHNMGNQDKRYVLAFVFDGATASEPVLEVWDDEDLDSIVAISLGEGAPSASWFRGKTTTSGTPGTDWVGSRLAGAGTGFFLWLNDENGPLTGATTLYCQLKVVIPATATISGAEAPVIAVKYTTN